MIEVRSTSILLHERWLYILKLNWNFCFWVFFVYFLFVFQIYREERQRGQSSDAWFTPQESAMSAAEPMQSQEPGASSGSATWVQIPKDLPGTGLLSQGAGWEAGPWGLRWVPVTTHLQQILLHSGIAMPHKHSWSILFQWCQL